jgi:hypothetical protein
LTFSNALRLAKFGQNTENQEFLEILQKIKKKPIEKSFILRGVRGQARVPGIQRKIEEVSQWI